MNASVTGYLVCVLMSDQNFIFLFLRLHGLNSETGHQAQHQAELKLCSAQTVTVPICVQISEVLKSEPNTLTLLAEGLVHVKDGVYTIAGLLAEIYAAGAAGLDGGQRHSDAQARGRPLRQRPRLR